MLCNITFKNYKHHKEKRSKIKNKKLSNDLNVPLVDTCINYRLVHFFHLSHIDIIQCILEFKHDD